MKHGRHRFFELGLAVGLLLLSSATILAAEKPCSNATLKGSFGFYRTGSIDQGAGGLAAVGILVFDGKGNASVLQSISRNGDYNFDSGGTFTYQLSPDCTGKGFSGDDGSEFTRIVIVNDGKGFYIFSESEGNAVYGVGTKIRTN